MKEKETHVKARLLAAWNENGSSLLLDALSEILLLEEFVNNKRAQLDELRIELVRESNESDRLSKRNTMLMIELENLRQAMGLGTADEHNSGGLE